MNYLLITYSHDTPIHASLFTMDGYDGDPHGDTVPFVVHSNQEIVPYHGPTDPQNYKFMCPECRTLKRIEEVMTGVTQYTSILAVEDGAVDYGEHTADGGEVDHYQCRRCGHTLRNSQGVIITDSVELEELILNTTMEVKEDE